jgi:hypothetical protein
VQVLEGNKDPENGELIAISLDEPLDDLQQALEGEGLSVRLFDTLSPEQRQITFLASDRLVQVHRLTKLLHQIYAILPAIVLLTFAISVALASNRWRAIRRIGIAIVLSMAVLAVGYLLARSIGLDQTANEIQRGAVESIFDALTSRLRTTIAAMFMGGLILTVVAWWLEPNRN